MFDNRRTGGHRKIMSDFSTLVADLAAVLKLERLGENLLQKLQDENLTRETFMLLNEADLRELGFTMGPRKQLIQWICKENAFPIATSQGSASVISSSSPDFHCAPVRFKVAGSNQHTVLHVPCQHSVTVLHIARSACKPTIVEICDCSPCLSNAEWVQSGFNCTCLSKHAGSTTALERTKCENLETKFINLPGYYSYVRVPGVNLFNKSAVLINAQIPNDLHVGFTELQDDYTANTMYEIVISGWDNTQSVIRKAKQGSNLVTVPTAGFLSASSYRSFWVTWDSGVIQVGQGTTIGNEVFMVYSDATPSAVNFLALTGWNAAAGSAFVKVIP